MTSTNNTMKQRKLSDLRVVDLQRELRLFNITFDKKELKGSLLEKLRQGLLDRNLDPDNYLFDTSSSDLKSISSDENTRNLDENGLHDVSNSDLPIMEIDTEQQLNPVHNNSTTTTTTTTTTNKIDNEENISNDHIEDNDHDELILTIDHTRKQEDENNNDKIDDNLIQLSCFLSDEQLDNYNFNQSQTIDIHHQTSSINDEQTSILSDQDEQHHLSRTTTTLSNDNEKNFKSEINQDDQEKKEMINKDQCHLWVSNIAKETHASDLKELFSKYGKVLTTKVIGSSSSQWFGYINLATPDDVQKCINALHQTELHGKKIYVDRDMYDQPIRSSSKSQSNINSITSSNSNRNRSDYKSSTKHSYKNRNSIDDSSKKFSTIVEHSSSNKRSASSSNDNKKKFATADIKQSTQEIQSNNDQRRNSSSNNIHNQSEKYRTTRTNISRSESSHKSTTNDREIEKNSNRLEKSSITKSSSPKSNRSHSNEKHSITSSIKSDHHRSLSNEKSKLHSSGSHHISSNKYDKSKEIFTKDIHRSNTFDNDRQSMHQNEQRLRHEKDTIERKQYVQHQEEEKIKEQQRRLAEERKQVRRELEILERERLEVERTRIALEREKQDQIRELEKQQRRLADEEKHRRQEVEAKIRDEKLHRISQSNNKRSRSSHHESQRSQHSAINNTNSNNNNNNNNNSSNKNYDHRSSTSSTNIRGRDRSLGDTNRDYYPEPKRQYTNNSNNQRESMYRDRAMYRDSDLATSSSSFGHSSTSMSSSSNNQRYLPSSSNQHRLVDSYNALPQRGRDMDLPLTSSISTAYERSSRNTTSSSTNPSVLLRRPHSRERFDDREYMQQAQRRERSPVPNNTMRREPMETTHWERSKSRDATHYNDDTRKYLSSHYPPESSALSQQQQGLWAAAPPSRQQSQHHHSDLSVKNAPHASVTDPFGWQRAPQQVPSQSLASHHTQGISSSHDRSRSNLTNNQRIPILPSNQVPPPPSTRSSATGQTHLYSHPSVPVNTLSTSQQHSPLAPPPSLHHTTAFVTQQAAPPGIVLHPTGPARSYEPHYLVTQTLPQRRY